MTYQFAVPSTDDIMEAYVASAGHNASQAMQRAMRKRFCAWWLKNNQEVRAEAWQEGWNAAISPVSQSDGVNPYVD